jgi:type I restriction enzyme S subunit
MSEKWLPRTLGESIRITKGITYASSDYAKGDDGEIFLTIKCFAKGGGFNSEGIKYYKGTYTTDQEVKPGDLLIAKTDLTRDGDIVGSPMVAPDFGGERKVLPSMDLSVLRPIDDQIDLRFLFYRMMLGDARRYMWAHSAGSTVLHLEAKALPKLAFSSPPPSQQRRIATILTTLDEVIEATEKLVEKHQQIKAGLMHDLFTRGLWTRPELARGDHKGTPAEATAQEGQLRPTPEEAPGLYQDSPIGPIPKAWKPGLLSDYLDPINGIKPGPFGSSLTKDIFTSSGFRVYGQEQVISGNLEIGDYYISPHKFAEMRAFEVLEGDVLLSLVGTVGCVLIVEAPFEPGIINPRLLRLRPLLGNASPYFVRYLLLTDGLRKQIDSLAGGGTMPVINGKIIRRLRIPMISPEEQKLIVTRIESLEQSVATETTHLAKLRQQKQGLMHDLLTGRVRVP